MFYMGCCHRGTVARQKARQMVCGSRKVYDGENDEQSGKNVGDRSESLFIHNASVS
jgi:hypothetical protein